MGPGYAREEVKEQLLSEGIGFVSDAVLGLDELAARVLGTREKPLNSFSRQEILRMLLSDRRISSRMPELRRLRRQRGFLKRLDRALHSGRLTYVHEQERAVLSERLDQRVGENPLREEVQMLADAYEAWLGASDLVDQPVLLRKAVESLRASGAPKGKGFPEKIRFFTAQHLQNLEQEFLDELKKFTEIQIVTPSDSKPDLASVSGALVHRWHSLDDAAEGLCDRLLETQDRLDSHVILIPDTPSVRRVITRALQEKKIPIADPRDPTKIKTDERIKRALMPLDLVSGRFERLQVLNWIKIRFSGDADLSIWIEEINARGIRQGLNAYSGGRLRLIHDELSKLEDELGGKRTCEELSTRFNAIIREYSNELDLDDVALSQMEALWQEFHSDLVRIGQSEKKAPPLYWAQRFSERLEEATPTVEKLRPSDGVILHRLGQAMLSPPQKLWFFGLPSDWLQGERVGDYWYSEREREVLSSEFGIRSSFQIRSERHSILREWSASAGEVLFWDAEYSWDGRERESLLPAFRELGLSVETRNHGGHSRWLPSFGAIRPIPEQDVILPPLETTHLHATRLEHYSRCPFVGLAAGRWKIWDQREPRGDLWPEVRGNILHAAIHALVESRNGEGVFAISCEEALELAWKAHPPRGLLKSSRLEAYIRIKLLRIIQKFVEKEEEYVARAGTKVFSLEGPELSIRYPEFTISGIPDRIDEHPEGLFILDYKSSSQLPSGKDILESGYRLQVPFYALAAQAQLKMPVIGIQYVELDKKGGRSKGVFFKKFNGKEKGKLVKTTANNKSLIDGEPDEAWSRVEDFVVKSAKGFLSGEYPARPALATECKSCRYDDLCGRKRISGGLEEEGS